MFAEFLNYLGKEEPKIREKVYFMSKNMDYVNNWRYK